MKLYRVYLLRLDNGNIKIGQTSLPMAVRLAAIAFYAKTSRCQYNKGQHTTLASIAFTGDDIKTRLMESMVQDLMRERHASVEHITESHDYFRLKRKVTDATLIKWFTEIVTEVAEHNNIELAD